MKHEIINRIKEQFSSILFFIIFSSPLFAISSPSFSDPHKHDPFQVLSWSVSDKSAIVEYQEKVYSLSQGEKLHDSQFRLQTVGDHSLVFSGDTALGEELRVFPQVQDVAQRIYRTTLFLESPQAD